MTKTPTPQGIRSLLGKEAGIRFRADRKREGYRCATVGGNVWVTVDFDLPGQAQRRAQRIADLLTEHGYTVEHDGEVVKVTSQLTQCSAWLWRGPHEHQCSKTATTPLGLCHVHQRQYDKWQEQGRGSSMAQHWWHWSKEKADHHA